MSRRRGRGSVGCGAWDAPRGGRRVVVLADAGLEHRKPLELAGAALPGADEWDFAWGAGAPFAKLAVGQLAARIAATRSSALIAHRRSRRSRQARVDRRHAEQVVQGVVSHDAGLGSSATPHLASRRSSAGLAVCATPHRPPGRGAKDLDAALELYHPPRDAREPARGAPAWRRGGHRPRTRRAARLRTKGVRPPARGATPFLNGLSHRRPACDVGVPAAEPRRRPDGHRRSHGDHRRADRARPRLLGLEGRRHAHPRRAQPVVACSEVTEPTRARPRSIAILLRARSDAGAASFCVMSARVRHWTGVQLGRGFRAPGCGARRRDGTGLWRAARGLKRLPWRDTQNTLYDLHRECHSR